jgi:hypothetical protein
MRLKVRNAPLALDAVGEVRRLVQRWPTWFKIRADPCHNMMMAGSICSYRYDRKKEYRQLAFTYPTPKFSDAGFA